LIEKATSLLVSGEIVLCWKEKGKYDVAVGTQKTSEELVKYWQELLSRYPSIIAIIDPLRKQVNFTTRDIKGVLQNY